MPGDLGLKFLHAHEQLLYRAANRVGRISILSVESGTSRVHSATGHHLARHADDDRVMINGANQYGICSNARIVSDFDITQDLGASADRDAIPDRGMPLARVQARATQGDSVVDRHVGTHDCRLADDNSCAVINEDSGTKAGTRVDLDPGQRPRSLGERSSWQKGSRLPQVIAHAVSPNSVHARVQQGDLGRRTGRWITLEHGLHIFTRVLDEVHHAEGKSRHVDSLGVQSPRPAKSAVDR